MPGSMSDTVQRGGTDTFVANPAYNAAPESLACAPPQQMQNLPAAVAIALPAQQMHIQNPPATLVMTRVPEKAVRLQVQNLAGVWLTFFCVSGSCGGGIGCVRPLSSSSFNFYGFQAGLFGGNACVCPYICPTAVRMEYTPKEDWHPTKSLIECDDYDRTCCPYFGASFKKGRYWDEYWSRFINVTEHCTLSMRILCCDLCFPRVGGEDRSNHT